MSEQYNPEIDQKPSDSFSQLLDLTSQHILSDQFQPHEIPLAYFRANNGKLDDIVLLVPQEESVTLPYRDVEQQPLKHGARNYSLWTLRTGERFDAAPIGVGAGNYGVILDAHPSQMLERFIKEAKSEAHLNQILDVITSEQYQKRNNLIADAMPSAGLAAEFKGRVGMTDRKLSDLIIQKQLTDWNGLGQNFTDRFHVRLTEGADGQSVQRFSRTFERTVIGTLHGLPYDAPQFKQMADFLWPLIDSGVLGTTRETDILSDPRILSEKPFAELTVHRLAKSSVEVSSANERRSVFVAKHTIKHLLERLEADPRRHGHNVNLIKRRLFPDPKRPDTLVLSNMVKLSNAITDGLNQTSQSDQRLKRLDSNASGIATEALDRILTVTIAKQLGEGEAAALRLENQLFTNMLGMMLEQRNYKALQKQ